MVTVIYYHNRLRSNEVLCYVDGVQVLSAEVNLPTQDEVGHHLVLLIKLLIDF